MKTRFSVVALALVAGLGGTQMAGAGMPGGQTPGAHAAGAGVGQAPEPVRLAGQPAVAAGFAAFPRLLAPTGAQAQRINKALAEADDRGRSAAMECRASGKEAQADPKDISWTRTVSVAMRGPRYLSVVAADDWFCGGAYPSTDSFALAYDMQTGSPLNWERLLPKALVQSAALDNAGDGTRLGVVRSPALKAMYLRAAKLDADCTQALRETDLSFMLWPDAQRNGVALAPSGLPHVIAACGADVVIPVPELRKLGVAPALLDAIATAYQAGLYGMGDGTPR